MFKTEVIEFNTNKMNYKSIKEKLLKCLDNILSNVEEEHELLNNRKLISIIAILYYLKLFNEYTEDLHKDIENDTYNFDLTKLSLNKHNVIYMVTVSDNFINNMFPILSEPIKKDFFSIAFYFIYLGVMMFNGNNKDAIKKELDLICSLKDIKNIKKIFKINMFKYIINHVDKLSGIDFIKKYFSKNFIADSNNIFELLKDDSEINTIHEYCEPLYTSMCNPNTTIDPQLAGIGLNYIMKIQSDIYIEYCKKFIDHHHEIIFNENEQLLFEDVIPNVPIENNNILPILLTENNNSMLHYDDIVNDYKISSSIQLSNIPSQYHLKCKSLNYYAISFRQFKRMTHIINKINPIINKNTVQKRFKANKTYIDYNIIHEIVTREIYDDNKMIELLI